MAELVQPSFTAQTQPMMGRVRRQISFKNYFILEKFFKLQILYKMELRVNKRSKSKHSVFWVIVAYVKLRKNSKKSKHRRFVLQQWLQTERTYNANLDLAIRFIKQPLLEHKLIDKEGINILCPEFQQMKQLSSMMVRVVSIIEKQRNPNRIIIGRELISFGSFYKLYYTYFGNRVKSEQLIRQLFQQNQTVMRQIEQRFKAAAKAADPRKQNMTISDCLEQPQYRMFKYVLLLKQYIKKLQRWHPDSEQMRKALALYEDINQKNNDLMGKLEAQAKKIKLDRLFGKSIEDSSHYIVQMTADSLYFPVKMYIFSNLVIVSAVQNILGFMDERRFLNIELNQFSIAQKKPDAKYFKNGLLLCGQYRSLHFFTQDPGSRQEIVATIDKVVKDLQTKATQKRQQKALGIEVTKKLSFVTNMGPAQVFAPQFRVQVLQIEVRPLSTFTNDTVYLTRFAGPLWWQDLAAVGLQQGKIKRGMWQLVEVHMSQVTQLFAHLRQKYPEVEFPQVDPLTKQINLVTQGKKNTKMYQVRGYLLQQFFNFIFRHPTVMGSPLQIISKYKLLQPFWKYLIDKNNYLFARGDSCKQQPNVYQYGASHCKICAFVLKADLQMIQQFRNDVMRSGNSKDTCFNALNLLRLRFAKIQQKFFDTVERVLLRQLLESGRIDYALIERPELHKRQQYLPIQGCGESKQFALFGDYKKKVGQYIIDLGAFIGLEDALDCRLLLRYGGKQRILDQDEVIFDLIAKYELPAEQRQNEARSSRASFNVTSIQKEESIFSGFFSLFKSKIDSCLVFRKIVYLPKEVEIRSMERSLKRGEYVINQLYSRLNKGEIMFEIDDWGQVCALWAVLNLWNQINTRNVNQVLDLVIQKLVPTDSHYVFNQKTFQKIFIEAIQSFKKKFGSKPLLEKDLTSIYKRCLRVFYRTVRTYTYLAPAIPHTIPASLIRDGLGYFTQQCWLGVNFKDLLVFRSFQSKQAAIRLNLQDVKTTHTTFSLFVEYGFTMGGAQSNCKQVQKVSLRFDGRMLFHFDYLLRQYANMRKIFPLTIA